MELRRYFFEKKMAHEESPSDLPCCAICSKDSTSAPTFLHAQCEHHFHADCAAILFTIGMHPTCPTCAAPLDPLPFTITKRQNHGVTIACRQDAASHRGTHASRLSSEAQMTTLMRHALRANFKSCLAQGALPRKEKAIQQNSSSLMRKRSISDEVKVTIPLKDQDGEIAEATMRSPLQQNKIQPNEGPSPVTVFDVPGMTPLR